MIRPRLVYAYEDGALETFRESNRQGIWTVYELPLTYWRVTHQILGEERELRPAWASTLDALRDSPAKLQRKDLELALSDAVVVPSRFVAESLALAPQRPKRIEILPYGVAPPIDAPVAERREHEPLRILYAGQLTQRKGLAYLFEALSRFEYPYELSLAGPMPTSTLPGSRSGSRKAQPSMARNVATCATPRGNDAEPCFHFPLSR